MIQQRRQAAYRWQYHAFSGGLGLLALGLMLVGRRRRQGLPVARAVAEPQAELSGLTPGAAGTVRPPWADRLETERVVLRVAVSAYLAVRAYRFAHRGPRDSSIGGRVGR